MKPSHKLTLPLLGGLLLSGCVLDKSGLTVDITGTLEFQGEIPSDIEFELYGVIDNQDAFDYSYCGSAVSAECYGRMDASKLTSPSAIGSVTIDGDSFTLEDVTADILFVLMATGSDETLTCTTDVVGFDETTKVVNADSAITFNFGDLDSYVVPTPVRLYCEAPLEEPVVEVEPEPEEEPEDDSSIDDEGDITLPEEATPGWTTFTISDKTGATTYGDASVESVAATNLTCDENFPSVLQVYGETEDTEATTAWIRIQFGSGDDATYTSIDVPLENGVLNQAISLTGGYSVVQLDLDEELDGEGESYTVSFCERDDPPAQEILTVLSWDKDDTDVDTHIYSNGEEVAYYSMSQSWGDLDIDDVDGFGPETFTSSPDTANGEYEVKVHYYSDHGNGSTNVSMRVVYYEPNEGKLCDFTATQQMESYDWWTVGLFGPGLSCPE